MDILAEANRIINKEERKLSVSELKKQLKTVKKELNQLRVMLQHHPYADSNGFWEKAENLAPELNRLTKLEKSLMSELERYR